jgi:hypothetical protein
MSAVTNSGHRKTPKIGLSSTASARSGHSSITMRASEQSAKLLILADSRQGTFRFPRRGGVEVNAHLETDSIHNLSWVALTNVFLSYGSEDWCVTFGGAISLGFRWAG